MSSSNNENQNSGEGSNVANNIQMQQLQMQQQQIQQQQMQMNIFWQNMINDIKNIDSATEDFKTHHLPLARIKKIMKSDEDVRMISAEAPVLFAKACEMFILELTLRSWIHTEENKRRTLQRNDIAMAITKADMFDFLIDIIPRDDIKPAKKNGMMDPQLVYQQQLQQQQAAMMQQYMQSQQGGQQGMVWPTQQQMIQQYQHMQQHQMMQQMGNSEGSQHMVNANNSSGGNSGGTRTTVDV